MLMVEFLQQLVNLLTKNNMKKSIFLFVLGVFFMSCDKEKDVWSETYQIENKLEIDISKIPLKDFSITDLETKQDLIFQLVDTNLDGENDVLLFQPKIKANAIKKYYLTFADDKKDSVINYCYSRFVPERTDDYAWENNKVAFRTYGPTAQKMIEDGVKGGTLSSGIDAWLKRVEYPIINKWYDKHTTGKGSYHEDSGEGLDNFHVGISRGVGGIAVKSDSIYSYSKNFSSWKTITNGPIRTSFILDYKSWNGNGKQIQESKHISLDYGQNLSKFTINLKGIDSISAGLTLHNKDGNISRNKNWISYWEPYFDSELGQGLVASDDYFIDSEEYITDKKDESNLYANLKSVDNKVVYYAGFGWKKSNQFATQIEWEKYLKVFAQKVNSPLLVTKI